MSFLPLSLGVRQTPDTGKGAGKPTSAPPKNQIEKILKKDNHTCRFCGFRSEKYQRVVHYHKKDREEWVTSCLFCEQCLELDRAGIMGTGVLLWLPEIGQAELNHIARAIYVGRTGEGEIVTLATRAYDALMARRGDAKKRLGSDDPLLLATVFNEALNDNEIKMAIDKLEGVRLMPLDKHIVRGPKGDVNQFPQIVKSWQSPQGPFAARTADKWLDMLKKAMAAVGNA